MPVRLFTHEEAKKHKPFKGRYDNFDPIRTLVVGTKKEVLASLAVTVDVTIVDANNTQQKIGNKTITKQDALDLIEPRSLDLISVDCTNPRNFRIIFWD